MSQDPARVNPIVDSFASVLTRDCALIDIGAGKGLIAQELSQRLGARVTMVDVASYNQTHLPLCVCDSRALAFGKRSFDFALLSFVLHHSPNPEAILKEALRVASQVIVVENDVHGVLRGATTRLIDSYPALRHGTPPCYFTWPQLRWLEFFKQFSRNVRVLKEYRLEYGFFHNFTVLITP